MRIVDFVMDFRVFQIIFGVQIETYCEKVGCRIRLTIRKYAMMKLIVHRTTLQTKSIKLCMP